MKKLFISSKSKVVLFGAASLITVKKFITSKGVDEKRLIALWFGQTKPIADNKTPEGRQKNRRVEMLIVE